MSWGRFMIIVALHGPPKTNVIDSGPFYICQVLKSMIPAICVSSTVESCLALLQDGVNPEALHKARVHEKLLDYAVLIMHEGNRGVS